MTEENLYYRGYHVRACWRTPPRGLEGVADLFTRQMKALGTLHPKLQKWFYINPDPTKNILAQDLDDLRPFAALSHDELLRLIVNYTDLVHDEQNATAADFFIGGDNGLRCQSEGATLIMSGSRPFHSWNSPYEMLFRTASGGDHPAPSMISYSLMYGIVKSFIDLCQPDFVQAWPQKLFQTLDPPAPFHPGWIVALSPEYADQIIAPLTSFAERRADRYLVMSATRDTFDVTNPDHIARARAIGDAIALLNEVVRREM